MERPSRREFLAGTAATAAGLAGCLGGGGPSGLAVETLAVEGSPGDTVAVKPEGQPALLDFFATWCAPCKPQMAELRTVRERYPDLHMLSLTRETDTEGIADFWREYDGTWPVASDPDLEAFRNYGITGVPVLVVLAADGTEVWRHTGLAAAASVVEQVAEATA